ncbi:MAG: phenylalanine--tRNA ligase subunit beta [Bryobacterales bacterium]|nr:phenylalanine--tRNA ligase subunit beta [Bryobacterales bacterium]
MRALISWLQDYVDIPETPEALAERLTLAGMAVDGIEREGDEAVLELDITSNRPDAMNHIGLAREIAAIFDRPLRIPAIEIAEDAREASSAASIQIDDPEGCPRYVGRVMTGVAVGPSPDWLRKRLELCGIRSINNIADLTNYVLLECGHPTHAFDLETLNQHTIVVRRAAEGEELRTLDGVERKLSADDLVIADSYQPVALAGVMGGLETEISDKTQNVLIEAAWFQPGTIRRTSRRFGMHTEASHRFERGADIESAGWAADRIVSLLGGLSTGAVLKGRIDAYPGKPAATSLILRRSRIRQIVGAEIPDADVERVLGALGFGLEPSEQGWIVAVPSWRLDVEREIDVIEEVARVWGYDRVPATLPVIGRPPQPPRREAEDAALRETLRALSYDETISYSFISAEDAQRFSDEPAVELRNPFSELAAVMRTSSAPTMLAALAYNIHRNQSDVRLFEIGRLYKGGNGSYSEPGVLTLGATGAARSASLQEPARALSFFDLKADVETLLRRFDLAQLRFEDRGAPAYYVPGRSARAVSERGALAYLGELDPAVCEQRKIRQPVFLAEVFLDTLVPAGLSRPQYRELPRVPAVERDFSLLVPEGIPFAEIRNAVGPMEHLVSLEPVEIFRGKQAADGFYSLLLRATWQRNEASFTSEEIHAYAEQLIGELGRKLSIQMRV